MIHLDADDLRRRNDVPTGFSEDRPGGRDELG
jgi:hypothetical protein